MAKYIGGFAVGNSRNPPAGIGDVKLIAGHYHRGCKHTLAGSVVSPKRLGKFARRSGGRGNFNYLGQVQTENHPVGRAGTTQHIGYHTVAKGKEMSFDSLHWVVFTCIIFHVLIFFIAKVRLIRKIFAMDAEIFVQLGNFS